MSSLLEQAIVDATALKEAAMKNAEKNLVEKYSSKIKEAVDKLLEQDEVTGAAPITSAANPEMDAAAGLENTPSDLASQATATPVPPTPKDPLEKVKPSYLKSKGDDELITIDFSSLKPKPVGVPQGGGMLPVTPVAPMAPPTPAAAPAAAPAAPPAPPLAEGLQQYEEDEGEIMGALEEEYLEEDDSFDEADDSASGDMGENLQALMQDGPAAPPVAEIGPEMDETVEIDLDEEMEEGGMPAAGMGGEEVENLGGSLYEEEEQDESGAYPEDEGTSYQEEVSLEEELAVDMDVVSDGWRGMQPNEKREQMNVALAKEQDEEYQRKMSEYQEALEASENRIKKTSAKNKALVKENEELKQTLMGLKEHVEGMNLSNAKLLYMNRILGNPSLNERQKSHIVESISKTDSVEGAKIAFETLQSTVASLKQEIKAPKSLNEAVSRSSSPFLVRKKETGESSAVDRMKKLAGIIKQ